MAIKVKRIRVAFHNAVDRGFSTFLFNVERAKTGVCIAISMSFEVATHQLMIVMQSCRLKDWYSAEFRKLKYCGKFNTKPLQPMDKGVKLLFVKNDS